MGARPLSDRTRAASTRKALASCEERLEPAEQSLALSLSLLGFSAGAETRVAGRAACCLFRLALQFAAFASNAVFHSGHTNPVPG